MRLIYMDEAGTSAKEMFCVVAAVIVEGDKQWKHLEAEISRIVTARVPAQLQPDFHIHATDIYSGGKAIPRELWPFEDRLDFLKEIACLPFVNDVPIAVGIEHKNGSHAESIRSLFPEIDEAEATKKANYLAHIMAFATSIERSDLFLRKYLFGGEAGSIIAEDVPHLRRVLAETGVALRDHPLEVDGEHFRADMWQKLSGVAPGTHQYRIEHIIDVPHFVRKRQAPILQLADVCAFSFRRCLNRAKDGDDLVRALLGPVHGEHFLQDDVWFSGPSSGLFNTEAYWTAEHRAASPQAMLERVVDHIIAVTNGDETM